MLDRGIEKLKRPINDVIIKELNLKLKQINEDGVLINSNCVEDAVIASNDLILNITNHQKASVLSFEYFKDFKGRDADKFNIYLNISKPLSLLQLAVRYNFKDVAEFLLDEGVQIDNPEGNTPLIIAARYNFTSTAELLIKRNSNLSKKDKDGMTALHFAAQHGNKMLCKIILRKMRQQEGCLKENVNAKDNVGVTPLHMAVLSGSKEVIQLLIDNGADITEKDEAMAHGNDIKVKYDNNVGRTSIQIAVIERDTDLIEFFAKEVGEATTPVNQTELDAALLIAVETGYQKAVEMLVERNADVNTINHRKLTPLHLAAINGHLSIVRYLLSKNANIHSKDDRGKTLFHRACQYGYLEIVQMDVWKQHNCLNDQDGDDNTALMLATFKGKLVIIEYLMNIGAEINLRDKDECTVLHTSIQGNQCEALESLLKWKNIKELVSAVDKHGDTPLHYAARTSEKKYTDLLLKNGADINIINKEGMTPLHIAAKYSHIECIKSMLESVSDSKHVINDVVDGKGRSFCHSIASSNHSVAVSLVESIAGDIRIGDIRNKWTPLHYTANIGCYESMKAILEKTEKDVNVLSNDGNAPLHLACGSNNVHSVKLLLDKGALVTPKNGEGKTCFDIAAAANKMDICKEFLNNTSTIEDLRSGNICTFDMLISNTPRIAIDVLDKCIEYDEEGDIKLYHFSVLDKLPDDENGNYFAPAKMEELDRHSLLSHSLTVTLIARKWNGFGRWVYLTWFLLNVLFTSFLTALVVYQKEEEREEGGRQGKCGDHSTYPVFFSGFIIFIVVLYSVKLISSVIHLGKKYFMDVRNLIQIIFWVLTFLFTIPVIACQAGSSITIMKGEADLQFQFGALAILAAWVNLLLLSKMLFYGLYVEMLITVMIDWIKVISIFSILILGFAFSFHSVLDNHYLFSTQGRSIISTIIWIIGEFNYDDTFKDHASPYKHISMCLLAVFLVIMTVTFINLLVGLAVGDIEAIRQNASYRILKEQVIALEELQRVMPRRILEVFHENNYNPAEKLKGLSKLCQHFGKIVTVDNRLAKYTSLRN